MNDFDESQLTAYVLGEVDGATRLAIEARVESDPALKAEIEQIRAVVGQLEKELAAEELPAAGAATLPLPIRRQPTRWGRLAIAAAVAVVVGGVGIAVLLPPLSSARRSRIAIAPARVDLALRASHAMSSAATPSLSEDEKLIRDQRRLREDFDLQKTKQVSTKDEKKIPYDDILRYPTDTPLAAVAQPTPSQEPAASAITMTGGTLSVAATDSAPYAMKQSAGASTGQGAIALGTIGAGDRTFRETAPYGVDGLQSDSKDQAYRTGRFNTEAYDRVVDNRFLGVEQNPLSTFSIDVDTASYANMRRFLASGQRPPKDAVRIEELVNYFPYDYTPPAKDAPDPFAAHVEVAECPWQSDHRLVRVALKGKEIAADKRPASNLVFLLDVSGSMNEPNKLPLVKRSMHLLLEQLSGEDRVAIVTYAGNSGLALPSTSCSEGAKATIEHAIEELSAGGSTNGEQGIQLAYSVAKKNFIEGGTNRVILCTDGDFNVGVTNQGDLTRVIEEKAKGGVFLSVLGFGMGNLKDSTMEKLADKGNGNYAYIDSLNEAKKVLVEEMSGTLVTIAKDVKIQIEFNPAVVSCYRLIGYENRMLAKEDFNDDKKDAGEIGAGHAVTALYEVVPANAKSATAPAVDPLKYQKPASPPREVKGDGEMLTLKMRYKQPDGETSKLMEVPVNDGGKSFSAASSDFKFASAVAAFGMILRESEFKGSANLSAVAEWAEDGLGKDPSGYRQEFIELVKKAKGVMVEK